MLYKLRHSDIRKIRERRQNVQCQSIRRQTVSAPKRISTKTLAAKRIVAKTAQSPFSIYVVYLSYFSNFVKCPMSHCLDGCYL